MRSFEKKEMFYEGKAKKLFTTNDAGVIVQEFKDSLTAFNALKKGSFENKGVINQKITTLIFKFLKSKGVDSHFVELLNDRDMAIKKLTIIPLEVVVRNKATGSLTKRLGIPEGKVLSPSLVEFYFKNDQLGDPLLTDDHVRVMGLANDKEIADLKKSALAINTELTGLFKAIGIDLIDFKIEFGKTSDGKILLADEITPDSCRLWDIKTNEKLDKDRFRQDLGQVEDKYKEVLSRIEKHLGKG